MSSADFANKFVARTPISTLLRVEKIDQLQPLLCATKREFKEKTFHDSSGRSTVHIFYLFHTMRNRHLYNVNVCGSKLILLYGP